MQGISANEHEKIIANYIKFEDLLKMLQTKNPAQEDVETRKKVAELTETYKRYRALLSELENCAKEYVQQRKSVQSVMYKRIRKINSQLRK